MDFLFDKFSSLGDVFEFTLSKEKFVVLTDPELCKELLEEMNFSMEDAAIFQHKDQHTISILEYPTIISFQFAKEHSFEQAQALAKDVFDLYSKNVLLDMPSIRACK